MANVSKRFWLLALVGFGVACLLLLGYLLWGEVLGLVPADAPPTQVLIALWDAYGQARAVAQAEAEDAQLVSASTQWQEVSEQALLVGANNWSFTFYSPASSNVLDIVVSGGAARVVNQTRVWVAPKALAEGAWQEGPRDVLLVFLAYGGSVFLDEHPQAIVDLHLAEGDEGNPVWSIVALDAGDRGLLALLVDAETRQVLSD